LLIVISLKYVRYVLRADNRGEGGVLALTALISPRHEEQSFVKEKLVLFGLFGTALLYGDGMITPAISVLSAVEGLALITPVFNPYIIPITVAILVVLFSIQKYGTSTMGKVFGPITLVWFLTLAGLGICNIIEAPEVLKAINPFYAIQFFVENKLNGFMVLGSVFLVVTGGEALYSDLGHFGIAPIKRAWFYIVLPCLILNYFGQGALLIHTPQAIKNPFFLMAPSWMLTPLVLLATVATVIASQALITGVFSITMHAVHLGYMPRVLIKHTSENEYGQIYVKSMNNILMIACISLVIYFKSSSNLAAAYGIAVTGTMAITTALFFIVAREKWNWPIYKAFVICGFFFLIDLSFLGANIVKIMDGGWVPLLVGILIFISMTTWSSGRKLLAKRNSEKNIAIEKFLEILNEEKAHRNLGTAVYMSSSMGKVPYALVSTFKHFKAVHEKIIFLQVVTNEQPLVETSDRVVVKAYGKGGYSVVLHYGYMEEPNIPFDLDGIMLGNLQFKENESTYFIGKENLFATNIPGMAIWREKLFAFQTANSQDATAYFKLPKDRVMEIGIQVEI
jgi:KUP system potassium uptake protein